MNKMIYILVVILFLVNTLSGTSLFYLKKEYITNEDKIYLKDITADILLPEEYGDIVICNSPFKKSEKVIKSKHILNKLKRMRMYQYLPIKNSTIVIKNQMLLFSVKAQKELIKKRVAQLLAGEDYKLEYRSVLKDITYPERKKISIELIKKNRLRKSGNQLFTVELKLNGRLYKRILINTYIRLFRKVLVSSGKISSGTILYHLPYELQEMEVTGKENSLIYDLNSLKGYKAGKIIFAGSAVKRSSLKRIPDIERGAVVEMYYSSGGISLALPVKALSDLFVGDKGRFYCEKSGKKYNCRVVSANSVKIIN